MTAADSSPAIIRVWGFFAVVIPLMLFVTWRWNTPTRGTRSGPRPGRNPVLTAELARYSATKLVLTLQSARDERLEIPIGLLSDKDQAALMMLIDGLPLAAPRVELAKMAALQRRTRVRRVAVMAGTVVVLVILLEVLSWNR